MGDVRPVTLSSSAPLQTTTTASSGSSSLARVLLLTPALPQLLPPASSLPPSTNSVAGVHRGAALDEATQAVTTASRGSSLSPRRGQTQTLNQSNPSRLQRFMRDEDRLDIIRRVQNGEKQADIARKYGFTRAAICNTFKNRLGILRRARQQPQQQPQQSLQRLVQLSLVPELTELTSGEAGQVYGGGMMQSGDIDTGGSSLGHRSRSLQSGNSSGGSGGGLQSSGDSVRSVMGSSSTTGRRESSGGGGDTSHPLPALSSLQGTLSR